MGSSRRRRAVAVSAHNQLYRRTPGERAADGWAMCAYCGDPADSIDHVPPVSRVDDYRALALRNEAFLKVPACKECNDLAGDVLDESFLQRAERVKDSIGRKAEKYLRRIEWDEEELQELGPNLRSKVEEHGFKERWYRGRLEYYRGVDLILAWFEEREAA